MKLDESVIMELTEEEKFEIIYTRLKETGKQVTKEALVKLCTHIMLMSTSQLADIGYTSLTEGQYSV